MATDDPVGVGILGAGRIVAQSFAPALRAVEGARLVAVASRDRARAKALDPVRAYGDYQEVMADPEVELVYIATHNGLHFPQALACLAAGKHVLCEKPLGIDATECAELVAAAAANDRHLVEAFMYRYHPQIDRSRALIAAGAIGELRTVEASFSFRHDHPGDVRLNPAWGGGALLDVGCYCVNACRLFLGDEPKGVVARGWQHPVYGVDFALSGVLDYGDGRMGVVSCGFDSGLRTHLRLSGTSGTLDLDQPFISWQRTPTLVLRDDDGERVEEFPPVDVYKLEIEDLVTAIRTGRAPRLSADEGLRNARLLDALREAVAAGPKSAS